MQKKIKASKIEVSSYQPSQDMKTPSDQNESAMRLTGVFLCVIGVILTPILIGIPFIFIGLFAMLFPNAADKIFSKK